MDTIRYNVVSTQVKGDSMSKRTVVKLHPEVIIKARLKMGWSQTQLADAANLRRNEVSIFETQAKASPRVIKAIAETLGLEIDDLVEITPPE